MAKSDNLRPRSLLEGLNSSHSSTIAPLTGNSSNTGVGEMGKISQTPEQEQHITIPSEVLVTPSNFKKDLIVETESNYPESRLPFRRKIRPLFAKEGKLRAFRLLKEDVRNIRKRYLSDWTTFNQLVFASAVYVLFTNLLPGITFASDLYQRTGKSWGTIEIVFSTGLCGIIFSL